MQAESYHGYPQLCTVAERQNVEKVLIICVKVDFFSLLLTL
jgi:hypothetical protein